MKYFLLLLMLVAGIQLSAQKKKKNPYADYWEQEALEEQFQKVSREGHELFQQKRLTEARAKYQQALNLKPEDQQTKAILRDIDLLIKKGVENDPGTAVIVTPPPKPTPPPKNDAPSQTLPAKEKNSPPPPPPKMKETSKPKPLQKPMNAPPIDKGSPEFREYLAQTYTTGWTEETYEEGKKVITKRVHVQDNLGDEYLQVKHHYGSVYYFKNGQSISYATWIAETEKK